MSSEREERWRLFCAVELSAEARERAAGHIDRLKAGMPDVRAGWERPEKLHITLKFLGETERTRAEALGEAAARAARRVEPFEMTLEGTGTCPPRGLPKVLWLGLTDASGSLRALQRGLEDACAALGFKREERSFHPHLTLARLRRPQGAVELARLHRSTPFAAVSFPVPDLLVIRSELGPGGSRYTVLSRHALGQRSA